MSEVVTAIAGFRFRSSPWTLRTGMTVALAPICTSHVLKACLQWILQWHWHQHTCIHIHVHGWLNVALVFTCKLQASDMQTNLTQRWIGLQIASTSIQDMCRAARAAYMWDSCANTCIQDTYKVNIQWHWPPTISVLDICRQAAYHGSSNHHKGYRPILWSVIHADGALVLCEHIGKGRVDGDGVDSVQPSRYISDADQAGFSQEMEPVIVLHQRKEILRECHNTRLQCMSAVSEREVMARACLYSKANLGSFILRACGERKMTWVAMSGDESAWIRRRADFR